MSDVRETKRTPVREAPNGVQRCGDWCRYFAPLDEDEWRDFVRCKHPRGPKAGGVFRTKPDCGVGETLGGEE